MKGVFRWTMRNGATILFAVAVLQLVAGLLLPLAIFWSETRQMAVHHSYAGNFDVQTIFQMSQLLYSLTNFAFILIGALLVDRADRWLALRERPEEPE